MKLIKGLRMKWKAMDTTGRVGLVIDILCKIGGSGIGMTFGNQYGEGRGRISKACVKLTSAGLGIAVGDIASEKLQENYAPLIAHVIDRVKEKLSEKPENKEEQINE